MNHPIVDAIVDIPNNPSDYSVSFVSFLCLLIRVFSIFYIFTFSYFFYGSSTSAFLNLTSVVPKAQLFDLGFLTGLSSFSESM